MFWKRLYERGLLPEVDAALRVRAKLGNPKAAAILLVNHFLKKVVRKDYSEIAIKGDVRGGSVEFYRTCNGEAIEVRKLAVPHFVEMLERLSIMSGCAIRFANQPSCGRIRVTIDDKIADFDVDASAWKTDQRVRITLRGLSDPESVPNIV